MLPLILKLGIATEEEEVDIDTMAERLRAETLGADGVVKSPDLVGAWARKRWRVRGAREPRSTRRGPGDETPALSVTLVWSLCYEALSLLSKRSIRLRRFLWALS